MADGLLLHIILCFYFRGLTELLEMLCPTLIYCVNDTQSIMITSYIECRYFQQFCYCSYSGPGSSYTMWILNEFSYWRSKYPVQNVMWLFLWCLLYLVLKITCGLLYFCEYDLNGQLYNYSYNIILARRVLLRWLHFIYLFISCSYKHYDLSIYVYFIFLFYQSVDF